jgi:hypothetical protein
MSFANTQPTYGVSVEIHLDKLTGTAASQFKIRSALHNTEEHLLSLSMTFFALTGPANGPVYRLSKFTIPTAK